MEWPASVSAVYRYMSIFNFSINLTPPECLFVVEYKVKWMFIEWFPTVMFGSVAGLYAFTFAYFRYCSSHNTRKVREVRNSIVAGSLLVMYVLYLNISENTLDPLNCRQIESDDGTRTEEEYMVSQPSLVCWQDDRRTVQGELAPYAVTFFVLYTLGYPALVAALLLKPSNAEKCINDQYLRCMGTGSRKETNKAHYNFRSKYATLYFKFKPQYHYWLLVIIARKLLIVTFTLVFHINATMQLSMILLVVFISYTLQVKYNPYLSRTDYEEIVGGMTEEEYQGLVGPYGSCPQPKGIGYESLMLGKVTREAAAAKARSGRMSVDGKRFARHVSLGSQLGLALANTTKEDLKEKGENALKFAFNYNTVDSALLFCSILVCLFGIMFASEFTGPGDILFERLGELTLAVIFVSLGYYLAVVWTEVVAVMFPSLAFGFLSGAVQSVIDADCNVVQLPNEENNEDDLVFSTVTAGMIDEEKDAYRLRLLEKEVVLEDTNPLVVREMETRFVPGRGGDVAGDEGDAAALLSVEDQVALQETVASLMEEIKALKKRAAVTAQSVGVAAAAYSGWGKAQKLKSKVGGARSGGQDGVAGRGARGHDVQPHA